MNQPDDLESRLSRAMRAEAEATHVSPDALARIRSRTAPAKRAGSLGWLRPAGAASALAFTLVVGTLAGVRIAGGGGGGGDHVAEQPPSVLFNSAASSGPVSGDGPAAKQPGPTKAPDHLPGFGPDDVAVPAASGGPLDTALAGPRTHQLPVDTGGSYVAITGPDSGVTLVGRSFELTGEARTFEANVVIEVSQNGKVVKRDYTTASAAGPEKGTWTKVLTLEPGAYRIDAFEESMEGNGARLAADTIWITLAADPQGAVDGEGEPGSGPVAEPTPQPQASEEPSATPAPDPAGGSAEAPEDQAPVAAGGMPVNPDSGS